ncbi:MAG: LysM peptidoglycan-binding domain-containing protein [Anaerolineae bacterium]|nr:LysM peptidoglycan-binding domain-containing protein [Anaerolineae bacterium]
MMWFRWLRRLFLLTLVIGVFGVVGFFIKKGIDEEIQTQYDVQVTTAIETAIAARLNNATRTAEAPLPQYRLVTLGKGESLLDVAQQYHTTVEVLRMANRLLPTVDFGTGETIVVPEGVQVLDPPRWLNAITAQPNDTLATLASLHDITLEQLQMDNPVLANRELLPGDIVFIPELLT